MQFYYVCTSVYRVCLYLYVALYGCHICRYIRKQSITFVQLLTVYIVICMCVSSIAYDY